MRHPNKNIIEPSVRTRIGDVESPVRERHRLLLLLLPTALQLRVVFGLVLLALVGGDDVVNGVAQLLHARSLVSADPHRRPRTDGAPARLLRVCVLADAVVLRPHLAEDGNDGNARRHDDARALDGDEDLLQRDGDRADVDAGRRRRIDGLEEHAVGDHREEEQRDAAGDALNAGEAATRRAGEDRDPHVVVGHLLADAVREEVLELGHVAGSGDRDDAFDHSVALLYRHPLIADEKVPVMREQFVSCSY